MLKRTSSEAAKESAAVHLVPHSAGLPCAAHKERAFRKVASLRRTAFPHFIPLLGYVKWRMKNA